MGGGGQVIRAPGTYGKILRPLESEKVRVRLPSGLVTSFDQYNSASIGRVGNWTHKFMSVGKAGVRRGWGKRPIVRGTAMNAVDHPHGGKSGPSRSSRAP